MMQLQSDQALSCGKGSLVLRKKQKAVEVWQSIKCYQGVPVKQTEVSCLISDTERVSVAGTR